MGLNDLFAGLTRFVLRVALLVVALVVVASLFVTAALLAIGFALRLLWARITGRPVTAFGLQVDPLAVWRRFRAQPVRRTDDAVPGGPRGRSGVAVADVQDVVAKERPAAH